MNKIKNLKFLWCFLLIVRVVASHSLGNIQQCFNDGTNHGKDPSASCINHSIHFEENSSHLCRSAFTIGCFRSQEIFSCQKGVDQAMKHRNCRESESKDFSTCCYACTFGLAIQSHNRNCGYISTLNTSMTHVMIECCEYENYEVTTLESTLIDEEIEEIAYEEIEIILTTSEPPHHPSNIDYCSIPSICHDNEICIETEDFYKCLEVSIPTEKSPDKFEFCSQPFSLCNDHEICIDTDDFYYCACEDGFSFNDSSFCVDEDECLNGHHKCRENEVCVNTPGSYECVECPEGHEVILTEDGFECILKIEVFTEGTPEIDYEVVEGCGKGLKLKNGTCDDVDECRENICGNDEICTNLWGDFRCEKILCDKHYDMYHGRTGKCKRHDCPKNDMACKRNPLFISHFFKAVKSSDHNFMIFSMSQENMKNLLSATPKAKEFDREHFEVKNKGEIWMKKAPNGDVTLKVELKFRNKFNDEIYKEVNVYHVYVEKE